MPAKILGQTSASAGLSQLYVCPAGRQTVVSTLVAVNTGTVEATLTRLTAAPAGASDTAKHTLVNDLALPAKTRVAITEGWCLGAGDVLRVSASGSVVVTVFGAEDPA